MLLILVIALIVSSTAVFSKAVCPENLLKPCKCHLYDGDQKRNIDCVGKQTIDLNGVFKRLSNELKPNQRHFNGLTIGGQNKEIGPNVTGDITFDSIIIASRFVEKIHSAAFSGTAKTVTYFTITLGTLKLNMDLKHPYDWVSLVDSFRNLKELSIQTPNLRTVPAEAFKNLVKLEKLEINVNEINWAMDHPRVKDKPLEIKEKAFYTLKQLKSLGLDDNIIKKIKPKVFSFAPSKEPIDIGLTLSEVNEDIFEPNSMNDFNRPVTLTMHSGPTVLKESVFKAFFDANKNNTIQSLHSCDHPENAWWAKSRKYSPRVFEDACKNPVQITNGQPAHVIQINVD